MSAKWNKLGVGLLMTLAMALVVTACGSGGGDDGSGGGGGGGGGTISLREIAVVDLAPASLTHVFDLSQVSVGGSSVYEFDIRNLGQRNLSVQSFDWSYSIQNPDTETEGPAFSCTYGDANTPCDDASALPFVVGQLNSVTEEAQALTVRITFLRPDDDMQRLAMLTINSNNKDGAVTLEFSTGESIPRIQVSPNRVEFQDVRSGETDTKFVAILNGGSEDLEIDRFTLAGDPQFTIKLDSVDYVPDETTRSGVILDPPIVLAPDSSVALEVVFAPQAADPADATLQLHSNDPTSEWTPVYFEAVQSGPIITVEPAFLEFGPRVVGRPAAMQLQLRSTGTEELRVTSIEFAEGSSQDFYVETDVSADNPLLIVPNDSVQIDVYFNPDVVNDVDELTGEAVLDEGTLVIGSNAFEAEVEVPVSGHGVLQDCPVGVILCDEGDEVIPQTNLHLIGDQSFAMVGEVNKWEWRVEQPVGSQSIFLPSPTFPNPTFEANVAGTYTFYLDVWDANSVKSCEPGTYEVVVIPDEAIHIELLWTTPGDPDETDEGPFAGSDVDLHFIHPNAPSDPTAADLDNDGLPDPYFDQPYDCYWFNPQPDWAAFGNVQEDDPSLDRDDTDGAGPENINLNVPEPDKQYQVAVHYWNDHGYGAAFVTVRIYIYQQMAFELSNVRLINHDLWCVAFVDWPSGVVTRCEPDGGGYRITPNYQPEAFFN